jgi:RNA polymerase sigma-70 factor (ECF subfamily)
MEQDLSILNQEAVRLVQQYLAGNSRAFHALVHLYGHRVLRIVKKMVYSYHDVEDLHNEIWLKVAQHLHKFDTSLPFHSWLYRIASNACIDFLRKRKEVAMDDDHLFLQVNKLPAAETNTPENLFLQKELRAQLESLLSRLDATDRLIVTLRFTQEMSYDEIGSIVGMSKNTVGTRLFRARKQLKDMLAQHLEERRNVDVALG